MALVFLNYRTRDTAWVATAAHAALSERFGDQVYLDHQSLGSGDRYPDGIWAAVRSADVLVVLIGPDWLGVGDDGVRSVDRSGDWVRREIALALDRKIPIVPVLVDDAHLPGPADLPAPLNGLLLSQAHRLRRWSAADDLRALAAVLVRLVPGLLLNRLFDPRPAGAGSAPSGLLRPERGVVPYHRLDGALPDLLDWARSPTPTALRLLTGPGGQGKTRLAVETCRLLQETGWAAGPVAETLTGGVLGAVTDLGVPLMLVLDEAERRLDQVVDLAARVATASATAPVRLLLVARSGRGWSRSLRRRSGESVARLLDLAEDQELAPLAPDLAARQAEFRRARRAFVAEIGSGPDGPPPADLAQDGYARALDLHAAALASALDAGLVQGDPLRLIADRDERYRVGSAAGLPDPYPQRLDQVVAAATLFGADTREEALRMLAALPTFDGVGGGTVGLYLRWVQELHPGPRVLPGMAPQQLAEVVLALALTEEPEILPRCATVASADQIRQAVRVLGDAAPRHPELVRSLTELLAADPIGRVPVAVDEAGRRPDGSALAAAASGLVGAAVTEDPDRGLTLVEDMLDGLPDRSMALGRFAVDLVRLAVRLYGAGGGDGRRGAYLWTNLAGRLCEVDEWAEAAEAAGQAVAAWRALGPDARPQLAAALTNFGLALNQLGDGAAPAVAEEAVELFRGAGGDHRRGLVKALLLAAGTRPGPPGRAAAAREAVEVARSGDPLDDALLAAALDRLATVLPRRDPEAWSAAEAAVRTYRILSDVRPDPYRAELVRSLVNLAAVQYDRRAWESAVAAAEEAVALAGPAGPASARMDQVREAAEKTLARAREAAGASAS